METGWQTDNDKVGMYSVFFLGLTKRNDPSYIILHYSHRQAKKTSFIFSLFDSVDFDCPPSQ